MQRQWVALALLWCSVVCLFIFHISVLPFFIKMYASVSLGCHYAGKLKITSRRPGLGGS